MKRIRSGLITDSTKLYNIILIRFRNMKKGKITAKIPVKSRTSGRVFHRNHSYREIACVGQIFLLFPGSFIEIIKVDWFYNNIVYI